MTVTIRPRRSALYVPGDNDRAIEKAKTLPADVLIFDLEDGVSRQNKDVARRQAVAAAASGAYGRRERVIRINGLDGQWGEYDAMAAANAGADAVLLPKVEDAGAVRDAAQSLANGGAPESLALWCMIETPKGALNAAAIAQASPRVACLVAGTNDLAAALHAELGHERRALVPALAQIVLAARAAGIACLDGVYSEIGDADGFARECEQGAELGFDGKTLIHPTTIDAANRAFAPTEAELDQARRIIAAHGEALAAGKSLALVDGKLVEQLHVSAAQRLLDLAGQIALLLEEAGFSQ